MRRKARQYTITELEQAAIDSQSVRAVMTTLGLIPNGRNHVKVKKDIIDFNIPINHFLGQSINKNRDFKTIDSLTSKSGIRKRLIRERGRTCESCELSKWMDEPITLEVHHKDGNDKNNANENLALLCPNCHSFTDTWRRKRSSRK